MAKKRSDQMLASSAAPVGAQAGESVRAADLLGVVLETGGAVETQLDRAIRSGLSFDSLQRILDRAGLGLGDISEPLMIQPRTLTRRRREGRLTPEESNRLFRLTRVFAHAELVLGGRERAIRWLRAENRSLGGRVPWELIETDVGATLVDAALGRIEHGVFA